MPDRRLFDSTSLTTPPEPRVEAASNNVDVRAKPGDVVITDDVIYLCAGGRGAGIRPAPASVGTGMAAEDPALSARDAGFVEARKTGEIHLMPVRPHEWHLSFVRVVCRNCDARFAENDGKPCTGAVKIRPQAAIRKQTEERA